MTFGLFQVRELKRQFVDVYTVLLMIPRHSSVKIRFKTLRQLAGGPDSDDGLTQGLRKLLEVPLSNILESGWNIEPPNAMRREACPSRVWRLVRIGRGVVDVDLTGSRVDLQRCLLNGVKLFSYLFVL
jgi:hypothetical protein